MRTDNCLINHGNNPCNCWGSDNDVYRHLACKETIEQLRQKFADAQSSNEELTRCVAELESQLKAEKERAEAYREVAIANLTEHESSYDIDAEAARLMKERKQELDHTGPCTIKAPCARCAATW